MSQEPIEQTPRDVSTTNSQEMSKGVPLALQYFQAVEGLTKDAIPNEMGYMQINLYPSEGSTRITIVRLVTTYKDGQVDLQDEIILPGQEERLQLNARRDTKGTYSKYPVSLQDYSIPYMTTLIDTFAELGQKDGSYVTIDYKKAFIAHNGTWISTKMDKSRAPHSLSPLHPELSGGKQQ